jgi:hypothetical protein
VPSDAYVRFINSFELDYDRWHDGEGFDLAALAEIDAGERGDIVHVLAQRDPTWREIEALEAIDIPPAFMAIKRALRDSEFIDTRLAAIAALHRLGKLDVPADELLAREIEQLTGTAGCTRALLMAEDHPTERVKQALLSASRKPTDCAMHCAGVLCYLTGVGKEPFDLGLRPLFLRLTPDEPGEGREAAFRELCALVQMSPSIAR